MKETDKKISRLPKNFSTLSIKGRAAGARARMESHSGAYIRKDGTHRTASDNEFRSRVTISASASVGILALAATGALAPKHVEADRDVPVTPVTTEFVPPTTIVVAEKGDSLWSLTEEEFEDDSVRNISHQVGRAIEYNGGPEIYPGQEVVLPDDPKTR